MQKQDEKNVWETSNDTYVLGKCTDHDKPHFDLFFTTISSKKMFFFRARAEKALRDTLTGAAWYGP